MVITKKKIKTILKKGLKTLSEEVLLLFQATETYGQFAQRMWGLPYRQKYISSKQLFQTVKRMKKRGWLKEKKIQDKIYYSLTREGRLQQKMLQLQLRPKERNTKATIIIFDIPEAKSNFRHFLRRLLLRNGFILLQKSVFMTPYKLSLELLQILKETDLLQYILIIEGQIQNKPV